MSSVPKQSRYFFVGVILTLSAVVRISLAWFNRDANDDHFNQIILPLVEGIPGGDLYTILGTWHPKLYHHSAALIISMLHLENTVAQLRAAQMLNAFFGLATVGLVADFLSRLSMPHWIFLCTLSLVALNPALAAINAQATNDTFVIFFGVAGTLCLFRYIESSNRYFFYGLLLSVVGGLASKGNGIILAVGAVLTLGASAWDAWRAGDRIACRRHFIYAALVGVVSLTTVFSFPVYLKHYGYRRVATSDGVLRGDYRGHSPSGLGENYSFLSRSSRLILFNGLLRVPVLDLFANPMNRLDLVQHRISGVTYPFQHMRSYWTQVYGNFSFSRFHGWPRTWCNEDPALLTLSRVLLGLNLIALFFLLLGTLSGQYRSMVGFVLVSLFAGIRYYMVIPQFEFAKFIYLAPSVIPASSLMAQGMKRVTRQSHIKIVVVGFSLLALFNLIDCGWLIHDLAVRF